VHGQSARYHHTRVGVGGRMDTLQCAVVLAKLERFDWELQRRAGAGARYARLLTASGRRCSCWRCGPTATASGPSTPCWSTSARAVQAALQAAGVPTAVHYPRRCTTSRPMRLLLPRLLPAQRPAAGQRVLSLPMSADLSEADQDRVVGALAQACASRARH
jgi:UDP-2-acetamido-2-deoxy-ribo-hexuluronate aminotransferase